MSDREGRSRPAGSPGILIVRLSAIGDIVMASPLIHALRRRYPESRIAWLVQPESAALLQEHPELDEVITWPRSRWRELWRTRRWPALVREVRGFRAGLRQQGFTLALDLQGLLKSGLMAWWSGACLLYTSPSPRDGLLSRMPSSA